MAFCPTCKSEFRPGFTRCEECAVDLVDALPETPKPPQVPEPAFVTVFRTTELVEAVSVKALLEGSGIEAEIENRWSGFSALEMPTSAAPIIISVPAGSAAEAAKILQETQGIRTNRPTSNRGWWWVVVVFLVGPLILALLIGVLELLRRL